jgi:hypothetical protein
MLTQPIVSALAGRRRVLLAGCGGGYDIMGALPLIHELRERDVEVHLASLSFCYLNGLDGARQDPDHPNLYAVDATAASELKYCPEAWLADFLDRRFAPGHVVHCFEKTGVVPLANAYRGLVKRLGIDAIVLIDGGVDALLRGDERSLGTPSEDLTSLAAVATLDVPTKILACVGLGAEMRDGISHADAFERIASLTARGAYLGAGSLVPGTGAGQLYLDAVDHVFAHQADLKRSHVHAVVSAACRGEFGARGPHVWLSPLLNMVWFFDADVVASDHLFLPALADTMTIWDVVARIEGIRSSLRIRDFNPIPL